MIPALSTVAIINPDPCQATGCAMLSQPIEVCRDHRCPHRWQRQGIEDRAKQQEHDKREREAASA